MDLFSPFELRGVTLRSRIGVSPMCQYSCEEGFANDWHLAHLGARAVGGAALVFTEATAVEARGRISPHDLGLWDDAHIGPLARVVDFMHHFGAAAGVQLAHAGRKASTARPWDGGGPVPPGMGGWEVCGPSPIAFQDRYPVPRALSMGEIGGVIEAFAAAAERAAQAGFDVIEIHAAHGYLLHSFLSPLSNRREDDYGGGFDGRTRIVREVSRAVRSVWAGPLVVRFSATDWRPDGWTLDDSVRLAALLREDDVDMIDCSSGGIVPGVLIPSAPGYQVPLAETIRREAGIATAAVGLITTPEQASEIIANGQADLVLLGREMLRDPYWAVHAAQARGGAPAFPPQYARAF